MQPLTGGWRSSVMSWRFLPKWVWFSPLNQRSCYRSTVILFHLYLSCIFIIFDFPFIDVRHRGCFSWQPLIVCLHPHGALLPPAEEPSCYPCAPRGTNNKCFAFKECKPHSLDGSPPVLAKCYIHMESDRQSTVSWISVLYWWTRDGW